MAAFAALSVGVVNAADISAKPINTPTLDYLHQSDSTIPSSGYTLTTPVNSGAENIITKYTYDATNGLTSYDFQVGLKNTVYGAGAPTTYYQWQNNSGKYSLVESATQPTSGNYITFNGVSETTIANPSGGNFVGQVITGNGVTIKNSTYDSYNGNFIANSVSNVGGGLSINKSTITNLTADFIGNTSSGSSGALYNYGTVSNLTGNFIGNSSATAGAIYNAGEITNLKGDFIGNVATGTGSSAGAIDNRGTIGNITGDFIGNSSIGFGGAIYSYASSIGTITGDFVSNTSKRGGAIYNSGTKIDVINANFINNNSSNQGGVIYNSKSTIENISGNFIGNSAGQGGVIFNDNNSTINLIEGNFIGNSANQGGAIYNQNATIGDITGVFIGNYAATSGGAIYNSKTLSLNNVTFDPASTIIIGGVEYNAKNDIYNGGTINVTGGTNTFSSKISGRGTMNFNAGTSIINVNITDQNFNVAGGVLNLDSLTLDGSGKLTNDATVNLKDTIFDSKYAVVNETGSMNVVGTNTFSSAISGSGEMNFKENHVLSTFTNSVAGQKINLTTGELKLDTTSFSVSEMNTTGGKVTLGNNKLNNYSIDKLASTADVIYTIDVNTTNKTADKITVGADSSGVIKIEDILFSPELDPTKEASEFTVQVLFAQDDKIQLALGDKYTNELREQYDVGSTIENRDDVVTSTVDFDEVFCHKTQTGTLIGTIQTTTTATTNDSIALKVDNSLTRWDDVVTHYAFDTLDLISKLETKEERNFNFKDVSDVYTVTTNLTPVASGVLNVNGVTDETARSTIDGNDYSLFNLDNETVLNLTNVKITNAKDVVTGTNKDAQVNIIKSEITENDGGIKTAGSVYIKDSKIENNTKGISVTSDTSEIVLDLTDNEMTVKTSLSGVDGSKLQINGGTANFDVAVNTLDININSSTVNLKDEGLFNMNNLTFNQGYLNLVNNKVGTMELDTVSILDDTNICLDVDLANQTMDRITASNYGTLDGNIIIKDLNILSGTTRQTTAIQFVDAGLKDNVVNDVSSVSADIQNTVYSAIFKYDVAYDRREDGGYMLFTVSGTSGSSSNPSSAFNPAVLGSSVSESAGALGTMNQTFNYAFQNADNFMNIPSLERISMRDRNKYALAPTGNATDGGVFSPLYSKQDSSSVWVKPYASFESVPLKNGPKVSNITYGTLVGFDTEMQHMKNGWDRVITGYIGYNGASQRYSGVDSYQNGGLLGGTMTLYKGNFFNATTLSVGASVAQNNNMYGSEDFAMLMSGIGNKTGYNFEFKEGKVILQPSMLMSYTFVNTFDYTNSAGVRIDNKPLHALQLAPGVKLIGNLKGGWQPYASVSMVWNVMGESDATANGVRLPQMSIKPYIQYGLGLQKRYKCHCMAFAQAMILNGGRNGVSLNAGFRWALGKDSYSHLKRGKVQHSSQDGRKVLKQIM